MNNPVNRSVIILTLGRRTVLNMFMEKIIPRESRIESKGFIRLAQSNLAF